MNHLVVNSKNFSNRSNPWAFPKWRFHNKSTYVYCFYSAFGLFVLNCNIDYKHNQFNRSDCLNWSFWLESWFQSKGNISHYDKWTFLEFNKKSESLQMKFDNIKIHKVQNFNFFNFKIKLFGFEFFVEFGKFTINFGKRWIRIKRFLRFGGLEIFWDNVIEYDSKFSRYSSFKMIIFFKITFKFSEKNNL